MRVNSDFCLFSVLILVFIIHVQSQEVPKFRDDYTYDPKEEAFYKEHTEKRRWRDAMVTCIAEGSQLAVPYTKADLINLRGHMGPSTQDIWIGINDIVMEGDFRTLNGTSSFNIKMNWDIGEPKDVAGNEDCVYMSRRGPYFADNCNSVRNFICKQYQSSINYNTICETYDQEYVYSQNGDRCYKFHGQAKSWKNARKMCVTENSLLSHVDSKFEADILVQMFQLHPAASIQARPDKNIMHLGFKEFDGVFKNIDGKALKGSKYEEWADGEPSSLDNAERCGGMLRSGKLAVISCNQNAVFFCEKFIKTQFAVPLLDIKFGL